jgi:hypothetical protein
MARMLGFAVLLCGLTCGCQEPAVQTLSSQLTLRYLSGCAPALVEGLRLEPLGDFAASQSSPVAVAFADGAPASAAPLPFATQWYRLSVETPDYRGAALAPAGDQGERLDALLLPLGRPCTVSDDAFELFEGSALTLIDGSDLLLAGGVKDQDGPAYPDVSVLRVARQELASDPGALIVARAGAVAVPVGGEVWILGGAARDDDGSAAIDTFERYVPGERAVAGFGRMRTARVGAAALQVGDGSVLVVGGRSAVAGDALDSIESISPGDRQGGELWPDRLPGPMGDPTLRALDNGRLLAVGASGAGPLLVLIDPNTRELSELDPPPLAAGTELAPALTVALPGERAALFAQKDELTTGELVLLLSDGRYQRLDDWLASFAGIEGAQSVALPDGRILLAGLRAGAPIARILDPGTREVAVRELDLAVRRMFLRDDGSVLMVSEEGVRVFREDARSRFDNPGGTLLADDVLCLDYYGSFRRSGLSLVSNVPDARFDLAGLRYRDVRIELEVSGRAELLLRPELGEQRLIQVGTEQVGPAFCQLAVEPGAPLRIERREQRITLRAGEGARDCVLESLMGAIAIGLRAFDAEVSVNDLRVERM